MMKAPMKRGGFILYHIVVVILVAALIMCNIGGVFFDPLLRLFLGEIGGSVVSSEGVDAQYFKPSYTPEELQSASNALGEQIIGEGAVLLKNESLGEGAALPLASGAKLSLFGVASVDPVYGGSGSGNANTAEAITYHRALTDEGFAINQTLWDFYETGAGKDYRHGQDNATAGNQPWQLNEAPQSAYPAAVWDSCADYRDAAIVFIARRSGEGADLPRDISAYAGAEDAGKHYLELTEKEKELLLAVRAAGFENIIVVINSSAAMELGFLDEEAYGITAALWSGGYGATGVNGLAKIISGVYNPSGRLVDTYLYDNLDGSPAMANMGDFLYTGTSYYYVVYAEGIYVGYRYYETRYEDAVLNASGVGDYRYAETVKFPFGYGMSYTQFDWSDFAVAVEGDAVTAAVTVTNTGAVAGKEVVQLYAQAPYTEYDRENRVEKSAVELAAYAKSPLLEPGESWTAQLTLSLDELASYDAYGKGCYLLEAGDYYFAAGQNAHDAVNHILAAKGVEAEKLTGQGSAALAAVYTLDETRELREDAATGAPVGNLFDDADITLPASPAYDASFRYLSRNDWEGTAPVRYAAGTGENLAENVGGKQYVTEAAAGLVSALDRTGYEGSLNPNAYDAYTKPVYKVEDTGLELIHFRDVPLDGTYTDAHGQTWTWDDLVSTLTVSDLQNIVVDGGYRTGSIATVNLPVTRQYDGPQGIANFIGGAGSSTIQSVMGYPAECMVGATWNVEIARQQGELIGEELLYAFDSGSNIPASGIYAPAANIHRTPFSGRNYEYYAEDGYLSGKLASSMISGLQSRGAICYMKHFVANDQETNRNGAATWLNEQSLREVYCQPFEIAVKERSHAGVFGIMTSYNRIGATWSGGHYNLLTGLVREEWGMDTGFLLTDYNNGGYMSITQMVSAGGDASLCENKDQVEDRTSAAMLTLMQASAKRVLYTMANSMAMNGITPGTVITEGFPVYAVLLIAVDALALAGVVVGEILVIRRFRRNRGKPGGQT